TRRTAAYPMEPLGARARNFATLVPVRHASGIGKPLSSSLRGRLAAALGVTALVAGILGKGRAASPPPTGEGPRPPLEALAVAPAPEAPEALETEPTAEADGGWCAPPRADAGLRRIGPTALPSGVLFVPKTFSSAEGAYDLYIHFHGSPRV